MILTDATSVQLEFAKPPRRIVSLVPSVTETLFDLGLDKQIVGVTDYCVRPQAKVASKKTVGGTKHGLDIEKILALRPDLVIANAEENKKDDIEKLREKTTVWVTFPRTVQGAVELIAQFGEVTGQQDRAEQIVQGIEAERVLVTRLLQGRERPRTLCFIWKDPWMTVNGDTFVHDLLFACGAANPFETESERYLKITEEQILAADPQVILLPSEPYAFGRAELEFWLDQPVAAAKTGRVHLVPGEPVTWWGSRLWLSFRLLGNLLLP